MKHANLKIWELLSLLGAAILLAGAGVEFYHVAWDTGSTVGEFSPAWFVLLVIFVLFCMASFAALVMWQRGSLSSASVKLISYRNKLNSWRWALAFFVLVFPVWFLQYTMWGIVFHETFIRSLIWIVVVLVFALLASEGNTLMGWAEILGAFVLTASACSIAVSLQGVTDYPFSLGWSEGNRLWDYSTLYGRSLYNYPADQDIYVLLDQGRLLVGGLPFLIPGLTIEMARLWVGLTTIIPYFLIGIAAYRFSPDRKTWIFVTLWIFLFLKQGPIHSPLVLAAAITILIWRRNLWVAIPLIIFAGNFAQASRYTWMFAPGIWIGVLELSSASLHNGKLVASQWARAIALGIAGIFGGYLLPKIIPLFQRNVSIENVGEQMAAIGYTAEGIASEVARQPLLWYRLLPNSTYGNGILLGLLIAVTPLIVILLWLAFTKIWILSIWQKLAIVGSLLAFLVVGLVASTKIGGGGDLHNMDMFLIGLVIAAVAAWYNGGREAVLNPNALPVGMKIVLIASLVIPALVPWRQMRSYQYEEKITSLIVLSDAPDEKSLDLLPSDEKVDHALEKIRDAVVVAKENGDVLFLDQRQLLTFGYVTDLPLVPEYEKKVLMNEALSANEAYFQPFYNDLASHRFSLIVSERFFTPIKDSSYEFGEENNAWVTWVANPVLCYYQEIETLKEVGVQLLVPKTGSTDCSARLP